MSINVYIEKLVYGGEGLAYLEGKSVFVPFVLPHETVRATIVKEGKRFVRAHPGQIVIPSSLRMTPTCPHFEQCGGCHYQQMSYDDQVQFKVEILRETLSRIGKIDLLVPIQMVCSPPWNYRNRSRFHLNRQAGSVKIGYFESGSNRLCPVEECPISSHRINQVLHGLLCAIKEPRFPKGIGEIEVFAQDREAMLDLFSNVPFSQVSPIGDILFEHLPLLKSIAFHTPDHTEIVGPGAITVHAAGFSYRISHTVFFQTNASLLDKIVEVAVGPVEGGEVALDLYCGAGLFTLPLTRRYQKVIAVDANPAAIDDLRFNALQEKVQIEAYSNAVDRFLTRRDIPRPNHILMDPPRIGLGPQVTQEIIRLFPESITYISCDPATLSRDLSALIIAGYKISSFHFIDLFPQTFHIESIVQLTRGTS